MSSWQEFERIYGMTQAAANQSGEDTRARIKQVLWRLAEAYLTRVHELMGRTERFTEVTKGVWFELRRGSSEHTALLELTTAAKRALDAREDLARAHEIAERCGFRVQRRDIYPPAGTRK